MLGDTGRYVTEDQASQISQAVKTVALKLGKKSGRNEYGAVYGELYRKFGVPGYKQLATFINQLSAEEVYASRHGRAAAKPPMPEPQEHYPGLDEPVKFRLASGDVVQITLAEGALGVAGYRLKIVSSKGLIAALPSAGNSLEVATLASLQQEQEKVAEVVQAREQQKARAQTPRSA